MSGRATLQTGRPRLAPLAALAMVVALAPSGLAYSRPGQTERVSVGPDGVEANQHSQRPAVSADGRYVAFTTPATNLVPGDTNKLTDVFVHDRDTGTTERVSVATDGTQGNKGSLTPSISADGRYVAFWTDASNLVPGDTNGVSDVFVHDRETGTTERVSMGADGSEANNISFFPSISADGRYVAFGSLASNLVAGDTNPFIDVFVHDRETGTTQRVSVGTGEAQGNNGSSNPSISADGRYVAFESLATNLVPGDSNGMWDLFVHDRQTGTTQRVSVGPDAAQANNASFSPLMSADGRYVAFRSDATNLVPGDTNGTSDAFVHDRTTGGTELVSVTSEGAQANNGSASSSISADGRYVAFGSLASNLVPGDTNAKSDLFVRDRATGATERVSVGAGGAEANNNSDGLSMSADGRYVAFASSASNLVPGDTNAPYGDVFVRDRGWPVGVGDLSAVPEGGTITVSGWASFSGAVLSEAPDLPADGIPGSGPAGAELTAASLTYRPEQEDLLVRMRLASLPAANGAGAPAALYAFGMDLAGARYEVRTLRAAATAANPSTAPYFALHRCDPGCTERARLTGGIGTTGAEVLVSVPLSVLGAQGGAALTGIRASTALGEAGPGSLVALDQVDLPAATIPAPRVLLGIAQAGTPQQDVVFDTEAALGGGSFSGALDTPSSTAGDYEVWARACLGEECSAVPAPIALG